MSADRFEKSLSSPVGPLLAVATAQGIVALNFDAQVPAISSSNVHLDQLADELNEYFAGERTEFSVPLVIEGTPFQQRVWQFLREIPFGVTRTYGTQAKHIGSPTASRAVGAANGQNRIAIVIPCHRVIGASGKLTGFAGGLDKKRWLLDHEQDVCARQGIFTGQLLAAGPAPVCATAAAGL